MLFKLLYNKRKWKKYNRHNFTIANSIFPLDKVSVGKYSYGELNVFYWNKPNVKLKIGSFCSIASDVKFFLSGEHDYHKVFSYPFTARFENKPEISRVSKGNIIVEDDVWIGYGCIILSGVTIGKGSVVGAGSVVSKDIPPYSIYCGNRVIKKRFPNEIIDKLLKVDFSKFSKEKYFQHKDLFNEDVSLENIDDIVDLL